MLFEVLKTINNFFTAEEESGTFKIENGTVTLSFESQYVWIQGSKYNDGLHPFPLMGLVDEEFTGYMTAVNPPRDLLKLVDEIEKYIVEYKPSPYVSESGLGYSYTKSTSNGTQNGKVVGWQGVFSDRLKGWRKV